MQMLTGITLDSGPDSLQERYYPEFQTKKRFPTQNHAMTIIESGPGRTLGCPPLMRGNSKMYKNSDTVNKARPNDRNTDFLQRLKEVFSVSSTQHRYPPEGPKGRTHLANQPS